MGFSKWYITLLFVVILPACKSVPSASSQHAPVASGSQAPALPSYDADLSNYDYRRPVQFFEFESQKQKLRMAYILSEPKIANGKTVVLLHGKNFGAWYWDQTIRELNLRGYRVIAPDQIGFGKSSKPHSYQFTFQQLAANTKALLESLKINQVMLVGHSMGGMLATRFALMFPSDVEKLVLVNPIGLEDWKTVVPYRTVDELYQQELEQTPEKIREYFRTSYFAGQWKQEYEPLIDVSAGWTRHPDYLKVAWDAALTSDMVFTQPVVYEFRRLTVKTLLIIGNRDRTAIGKDRVPETLRASLGNYAVLGKKIAKEIPVAQLVEIDGVGHMPQVEAFDSYFQALTHFLK